MATGTKADGAEETKAKLEDATSSKPSEAAGEPPEGTNKGATPCQGTAGSSTACQGAGESVKVDNVHVGPRDAKGVRVVECTVGCTRHRDRLNTDTANSRKRFIGDLARKVMCSPTDLSDLEDRILSKADEVDKGVLEAEHEDSDEDTAGAIAKQKLEQADPNVLEAAERFLKSPRLFEELACDFAELGIVGETQLATWIYLTGVSRLAEEPLHVCVQAASASGKSFVADTVLGLMPPECIKKGTQFSPHALYDMKPGSLENKIVYVAERRHSSAKTGSAAANEGLALREMLSNGEIRKEVSRNGQTVSVHQQGPIAYVDTTTQVEIFHEDATRLLTLQTDTSVEQTLRINQEKAKRAAGKGPDSARLKFIVAKHHAAQRMLKELPVRIRFAEHLQIPTNELAARRQFNHLLSCVKAVALLRQSVKRDIDGHIYATDKDYKVAYELMLPVLRRALSASDQRAIELGRIIQEEANDQTFEMKDMEAWSGWPRTTINDRLRRLCLREIVVEVTTDNHRKKTYRMPKPVPAAFGLEMLPTPEALGKITEQEKPRRIRRRVKKHTGKPRPK